MDDEDWVEVAMKDDAMVVDVLIQLSKSAAAMLQSSPEQTPSFPRLAWSVRQRRSRHVKKGEPARGSPTTPLSWSGATSASGGGSALDGFEESSKPKNSARSKVSVRREATTSRRTRKKTLAQLKEEVNVQMKEQMDLRNEIAALRLTCEKETAINERLKQLQLDLQSQQTTKALTAAAASGDASPHRVEQVVTVCEPASVLPILSHCNQPDSLKRLCTPNEACKLQEAENKEIAFPLPDLNLSPEENVAC